jgi:hypothetical protein
MEFLFKPLLLKSLQNETFIKPLDISLSRTGDPHTLFILAQEESPFKQCFTSRNQITVKRENKVFTSRLSRSKRTAENAFCNMMAR